MEMNLTRAEFNEITKDLVERTAIPVNQALSDAEGICAAKLNGAVGRRLDACRLLLRRSELQEKSLHTT